MEIGKAVASAGETKNGRQGRRGREIRRPQEAWPQDDNICL